MKETWHLAGMLMKGITPILSVLFDLVVIVQETRNGGEPAILVKELLLFLESLKIQSEEATGVPIYFQHQTEEQTISDDDNQYWIIKVSKETLIVFCKEFIQR